MISGAVEDLDQIIEIDNQLSINHPITAQKPTSRFKNLCVSLFRDRRFMTGVGLVTLGVLIIGGYYITVDPIQKQAYASFMNQTQIPVFSVDPNFDYDIPSCFDSCALSTGSGFFTNHPGCHNYNQDPQCLCYGEPINTTCYMTPDSICPDGGCANLIIGNSTQWINALASECNFNRTSGHWVNYIQSILNKTRSAKDTSDMYTCTPSIDGTSIICGKSWDHCWYMNGICLYLYRGSAQCAADLARYQHMVTYFAPTSVLYTLIIAIVGAYWYWY